MLTQVVGNRSADDRVVVDDHDVRHRCSTLGLRAHDRRRIHDHRRALIGAKPSKRLPGFVTNVTLRRMSA